MKKLTLLLFFCFSNIVLSQDKNLPPFIEVTGTAEKEIEPNQIYVTIFLTEKSIDDKKYSIEAQEMKLKQSLNDMNIPLSKLVLANFTSSIITEKRKEIGIKQNKLFQLILESGSQVSQLFDKLADANIKEAFISKTDHTDIVNYNKEVRIDALKAAKSKAEYLLNAVGNKIGKPLEIIELTSENSNYRSNSLASNSVDSGSSSAFKKIKITFSFKVKYSIE